MPTISRAGRMTEVIRLRQKIGERRADIDGLVKECRVPLPQDAVAKIYDICRRAASVQDHLRSVLLKLGSADSDSRQLVEAQTALDIDFDADRLVHMIDRGHSGGRIWTVHGTAAFVPFFGDPYISYGPPTCNAHAHAHATTPPKSARSAKSAKSATPATSGGPGGPAEQHGHTLPRAGRFSTAHAGLASALFVYHSFDNNPSVLVQAIGGYMQSVGASPWSENCAVLAQALHEYYSAGGDPAVLVGAIGTSLARGTGPKPSRQPRTSAPSSLPAAAAAVPAPSSLPAAAAAVPTPTPAISQSDEITELLRRRLVRKESPADGNALENSTPNKRQRCELAVSEQLESQEPDEPRGVILLESEQLAAAASIWPSDEQTPGEDDRGPSPHNQLTLSAGDNADPAGLTRIKEELEG